MDKLNAINHITKYEKIPDDFCYKILFRIKSRFE